MKRWFPLTHALNSLNCSLGVADASPLTLAPRVIDKLRFVHKVIVSAATPDEPMRKQISEPAATDPPAAHRRPMVAGANCRPSELRNVEVVHPGNVKPMKLRVGYELVYQCAQPTSMLLMLNTHFSRARDVIVPEHVDTGPFVPLRQYCDSFGNLCTRLAAPAAELTLSSVAVFDVPPGPELPEPDGYQHSIEEMPDE